MPLEEEMEKKRIAVVTTDGVSVDEHFGRAEQFWIYDTKEAPALVEKRKTETWSVGDPNHRFDPEKFARVSALLEDCTRIYVTRIGEVPAARLKEAGVEPVIYTGKIADITI